MANYLVTGGAGFIGSHLVEELLKRGETVRIFDNFSTGKRENIQNYLDRIEVVEGSLTDPSTCHKACQDIDYILHQGAIPSVPRSVENPGNSHEANITGTLNLLMAMRDCHCKRLVYAASSSAYGDQPIYPTVETMKTDPLSPYAVTKLCSEMYCRAFALCYGIETVCLRYFNVFGPRQDPQSQYGAVIPRFISAVLSGNQPIIYGDGLQSRDFTFVANNVEANLLAATREGIPTQGDVFNIACGHAINLIDLLEEINRIIGTNIKAIHEDARAGDIRHSYADIRKAQSLLGFEPVMGWKEGLRLTVDWFQE
jgi:nucleoside-diphosphate-sugar epimerase